MRMLPCRPTAAPIAVLAAVLLYCGCAVQPDSQLQGPPAPAAPAATATPTLPALPALPAAIARGEAIWGIEALERFESREPLPSCGELADGQPGLLPADLVVCMENARGTGAELTVTATSEEGDPYVLYYRVGPSISGIQMFVDSTRDPFGGGSWSEWACPDAPSIKEISCAV